MSDDLELVRQAATKLNEGRDALHEAIKAAAQKHSLRAIADAAGLSHQTVANIIKDQP